MLFEVGETVVYPHHGAATIIEVKDRIIKGETKKYLKLNVTQGDLIIEVPAENVDLVGVRDVIGKEGLDRVFEVLRAPFTEEPTNWSRRYKANLEKLASGDVIKVSEVVRDLWRRDQDRGLSAGEKRMLAKAKQILISELALAEKTDEEKAGVILDEVLAELIQPGLDSSGVSIAPVPRIAVIVVAAGSGTRLGAGRPEGVRRHRRAHDPAPRARARRRGAPNAQVVVVAPAGREGDALTEALAAAGDRRDLVSVVTGGATRQASVAAGLARAVARRRDRARARRRPRAHAARRVRARHRGGRRRQGGVDPGAPRDRHDQARRRRARSSAASTAPSSSAAQTPQGFRRDMLDAAYRDADRGVHRRRRARGRGRARRRRRRGRPARVQDHDGRRPRARARRSSRGSARPPSALENAPPLPRVGVGTDVHAFGGDGRPVARRARVAGRAGAVGHSDGDAVAHAIVDALLSAAGLGDIGTHFGTDHPEYAGAHADVVPRAHACAARRGRVARRQRLGAGAGEPPALRRAPRRGRGGALGGARRGTGVGRRRPRPTASASPAGARASRPSPCALVVVAPERRRAQSARVMKTENGSSA